MLSPPEDFPEELLVSALQRGWSTAVASVLYRAIGFGSHHWEVVDDAGTRWFVTVDELETKQYRRGEPLQAAFDRLRACLAAAVDLQDWGHKFVVAPVLTREREPLLRTNDKFGVALYPFVEGRSFSWGEFSTPAHRGGTLELVVALHQTPMSASRQALADDFAIPHRDDLEATLDSPDNIGDGGPYARRTSLLVAGNAVPLRQLLARYDGLVAGTQSEPYRTVFTHGEPHPGNTMLTSDGWRLVDWDTLLVAPPERDLWSLDPGDGSVLDAYAEATSARSAGSALELYRIRWDLADIADAVSRFCGHHSGSADDDKSWEVLASLIGQWA
jgi:hypothetical protein